MSNYQSEHGTYVLTAGGYKQVKAEVTAAANVMRHKAYLAAVTVYNQMMAQAKGKRNFNFGAVFEKLLEDVQLEVGHALIKKSIFKKFQAGGFVNGVYQETNFGKPHQPKESDFKPLKPAQVTVIRVCRFAGQIQFDDKTKRIAWVVDENNHAVDEARETYIAGKFFSALANVKWTGKTGGRVEYMDEYISDRGNFGPFESAYPQPDLKDRYGVGAEPTLAEKEWDAWAKQQHKKAWAKRK